MDYAQATKTAEGWFSEDNDPDPNPMPQVCGYYLLVKPLKAKEKVGSILLPDQVKDDVQQLTNVARVLAVGPEAYKGERFAEPWCKVGDYVVFQKFRGSKILVQNIPVTLIADDEVLMVVESPEEINNSMFNFSKGSS